jgi:hypothetical protein
MGATDAAVLAPLVEAADGAVEADGVGVAPLLQAATRMAATPAVAARRAVNLVTNHSSKIRCASRRADRPRIRSSPFAVLPGCCCDASGWIRSVRKTEIEPPSGVRVMTDPLSVIRG